MAIALMAASATLLAQTAKEDVRQNTTFGGYVISKAEATTSDDATAKADFGIRLVRLYVDSKIGDFAMKLQVQANGNTSGVNGPRIVDAWAEWQRWRQFRVKAGQFKRPFTFENPMHPWLIGKGNYSQLTLRLAGFNDRTGEHASNGRDIGIQLQGDLFPIGSDGHSFLHYQGGVFTGQGINFADKDTRKDFIGGLWIAPLKELQIGVFGWTGNRVGAGDATIERRRYNVGVNYNGAWTARSEFAVDNAAGGADAFYALVGTPSWHRSRLFLHYDLYREGKSKDGSRAIYGLSAQHMPHPNVMLQANYGLNAVRALEQPQYHSLPMAKATTVTKRFSTFDLQLYWRF